MLRVRGLSATYGKAPAIDHVSIEAPAGEITGVVGANGAGKSTLVRCVAGLKRPVTGRITISTAIGPELDLTGRPPWEIAEAGVLFVPESGHVFPSLTVSENIAAALSSHRVSRQHGVDVAGLVWSEFVSLRPLLGQRAATLSGGERRLVGIARAVAVAYAMRLRSPEPECSPILIFDEPTSGLSPAAIERLESVLRRLRSHGWGLVLVEQMVPFTLALSQRVYVMDRGRVVRSSNARDLAEDEEFFAGMLAGGTRTDALV